jgi:hypothetical protein
MKLLSGLAFEFAPSNSQEIAEVDKLLKKL